MRILHGLMNRAGLALDLPSGVGAPGSGTIGAAPYGAAVGPHPVNMVSDPVAQAVTKS